MLTVFALVLATYVSFQYHSENELWANLKEKKQALGDTHILIRDLTDFEWDTVCVLSPYSAFDGRIRDEEVSENIGNDTLPGLPDLDNDGDWAFLFIKEGTVIKIIERGSGYYIGSKYSSPCISSKEAKFEIEGYALFIVGNI